MALSLDLKDISASRLISLYFNGVLIVAGFPKLLYTALDVVWLRSVQADEWNRSCHPHPGQEVVKFRFENRGSHRCCLSRSQCFRSLHTTLIWRRWPFGSFNVGWK